LLQFRFVPRAWRGPLVLAALFLCLQAISAHAQLRAPDVRYDPSPVDVVQAMLKLADVKASDVVYDLGCGDGRIVIAAVVQFGARGVCVDIDPVRIAESRENARKAGVEQRIRFVNEDLFTTGIGDASVVMLFLWPEVNLKLRPRLLGELAPGSRIVSHFHDMGDWKPEQSVRLRSEGYNRNVYLWTVPPQPGSGK
jgi:ribosomal protein L11 methylase PrmA